MAGATMLGRRFRVVLLVAIVLLIFFWIVGRGVSWLPVLSALGAAVGVVYFGLSSRTVTAGVKPEDINSLPGFIMGIVPILLSWREFKQEYSYCEHELLID